MDGGTDVGPGPETVRRTEVRGPCLVKGGCREKGGQKEGGTSTQEFAREMIQNVCSTIRFLEKFFVVVPKVESRPSSGSTLKEPSRT